MRLLLHLAYNIVGLGVKEGRSEQAGCKSSGLGTFKMLDRTTSRTFIAPRRQAREERTFVISTEGRNLSQIPRICSG